MKLIPLLKKKNRFENENNDRGLEQCCQAFRWNLWKSETRFWWWSYFFLVCIPNQIFSTHRIWIHSIWFFDPFERRLHGLLIRFCPFFMQPHFLNLFFTHKHNIWQIVKGFCWIVQYMFNSKHFTIMIFLEVLSNINIRTTVKIKSQTHKNVNEINR